MPKIQVRPLILSGPALVLLLASSLSAQNILAYHGNCGGHFDPVPGAAAQFPGATLTQTTVIGDFQTMAAMGGWDVLIYDSYSPTITTGVLDELSAQLALGAGVIFYYWRVSTDGISATHPLFTVDCPVTFTGTRSSTLPWEVWDPVHPIATTPNALTWPLPAVFDTCGVEGQFVEPIGGSTSMAGFTPAPAPDNAGIILSPTGRMIFNAQILGLFSNADSQDLLANEIAFLSGCRGECDFPNQIRPTVPAGCPGARTTDDTIMVDSTQCMLDEATPSCSPGGEDSFASFVAPFDGMATADTCGMGTAFDTILVAYDGVCGALNELACNNDTCGTSSQVAFSISAGTTYYLLVDGVGGATGLAEVRLQLTEVPTDFVPFPGVAPNTLTVAAPRMTAIETMQLASTTAGGSQVAWLPCFDQFYAFDTTGPGSSYEVFSNMGAQVSVSSMVGVFGRAIALNPLTGNLEVISAGAMAGGGASDGLIELDLDASALYDVASTQLLPTIPGLIGPNTAPALDYDRNVWYSREGGDTVNVVDATTGAMTGTIILDSVAAGSPTFVANGIAYTGLFGLELAVGSADAVHIFDLAGGFVSSVPLGVTLAPGDFSGSFVRDLYWSWDGLTGQWRGFDIFDGNFSTSCSTATPGVDLILAAGAHTIDTDTGNIDGMPSMAFTGTAFDFDNVDIQAGATVAVTGSMPLIINALGDIDVAGDIDVSGTNGVDSTGCNSPGGAGGPGGPGGSDGGEGGGNQRLDGLPGMGPGFGSPGLADSSGGGGAGYAAMGGDGTTGGSGMGGLGGIPYITLLPVIAGGSGGGGGAGDDDGSPGSGDDGAGGGGGGGGGILLNAGGTLTVSGNIDASGGDAGMSGCNGNSGDGGGGSGGWIGLLDVSGAPLVMGSLDISGGIGAFTSIAGGAGSDGRLFMDMTPCGFSCTITGPMMPPTSSLVTVQIDAATGSPTYDATFEFSLDGGMTFSLCTAALGPMGAPPVVPNPALGLIPGMATAFRWNGVADGVPYPANGVLVRATVSDGMAMTACLTAPFDIGCECGDCNVAGDGITITDALVAAQIAAGLMPPGPGTAEQQLCCDTSGSGFIEIIDALQMAQASAGLPFVPLCP